MPAKSRKTTLSKDSTRVWLTYPPQKIKRPIIWELGKKFDIVTDIRQASVNDEVGIVCLEIDGKRSEDYWRAHQVPMSEVLKYAPDLRSITSGRGEFQMEFSHYEELPPHLAEKVIKDAKARHAGEQPAEKQ